MTRYTALLVLGLAVCGVGGAAAQSVLPFAVGVRGGVSFPTGDLGRVAGTGYGYGVEASYRLAPLLGLYAGYSKTTFGRDNDAGARDGGDDISDQGLEGGVKVTLPGLGVGASPFVRGGLVYHEIDSGDTGVAGFSNDDQTFGFEVGGGLIYPLGQVVSVVPAVRFQSYRPATEGVPAQRVGHLDLNFGLEIRF